MQYEIELVIPRCEMTDEVVDTLYEADFDDSTLSSRGTDMFITYEQVYPDSVEAVIEAGRRAAKAMVAIHACEVQFSVQGPNGNVTKATLTRIEA